MLFTPKVKLNRLETGETNINEYLKQPVKKGLVMFYGDSGFTRWKEKYGNPNLEDVLLGKDGRQAVVNHGFGSSTADELLYYYPRLVRPWAPRALVFKVSGNDFGFGYSPFEIVFLQARLIEYARRDFPGIKFFLTNTVPQLRYKEYTKTRLRQMSEYNSLTEDYCLKHEDPYYLDQMNCPLFYKDPAHAGEIEYTRDDIYIEDKGHFNPAGYELYRQFFAEKLKDVL